MALPIGEEIFINICEDLPVGEIFVGELCSYSMDGPPRKVAVKCIRKASLEEYMAFIREHDLGYMVDRNMSEDMRFYLVKVLD